MALVSREVRASTGGAGDAGGTWVEVGVVAMGWR